MNKQVVIFSHQTLGVLFVADHEILTLAEEELIAVIKQHLQQQFPHLLQGINFDAYELISVVKVTPDDIRIEIIGDDGILYISGDTVPVWTLEKEPVLISGEEEKIEPPKTPPPNVDDVMRTI